MGYAARKDGQGWRAVNGPGDVGPEEFYSEEPIAIVQIPPTRQEAEVARLRAYADPLTGSDRYFAEAQRESLMGNEEAAEAAKALGMARFAEIQAENPWPTE